MFQLTKPFSTLSRGSQRTVVMFGAAILLLGIIAYANIPDSNGVIHGCYKKSGGTLRVIDYPATQCDERNETLLSWAQTGPEGPQGVQGPAGPQGPQGPVGPAVGPRAMVSVNEDGTIERCVNGVTGATAQNCGFAVRRCCGIGAGAWEVNFGDIDVSQGFYTISHHGGNGGPPVASEWFSFVDNTSIAVTTNSIENGDYIDKDFMVVVY